MVPQLNFLGKKLFIEHILSKSKNKGSECFLRSLLINKRFLNIANNRRIYKIKISLGSKKSIRLSFESYTEHSSYCYGASTFEFICCVLKLLKPSFTEFYYGDMYHEEKLSADSLLTLMQLAGANGKVSLRIHEQEGEDFSGVLEHVRECVDELTCNIRLLRRTNKVKFKLLDKLEVFHIESNDELNAVLKHPAKRLDLDFYWEFDGEPVQLHKNGAKQCTLYLPFVEDVELSHSIIQNVLNACEKLETLDLKCGTEPKDITDSATFLNEISQHYQMFATLIELIRQLSPNPTLNIIFDSYQEWDKIKIKLPEDWQKQVKQIGGLQDSKIIEENLNTYVENGETRIDKEITLQIKIDSTNATFFFRVLCEYSSRKRKREGD